MGFQIVALNVLSLLIYILCGYLPVKAKLAETSHARSLAAILMYVLNPCLFLNAVQNLQRSPECSRNTVRFFLASLTVMLLFFGVIYACFHKKYADARYRILSIGAIMGNVGFLGLPLVTSLFPNEPIVAVYSATYGVAMNLLVFSVGVYMITNDRKYFSLKSALVNPTGVGTALALLMYVTDFRLPSVPADIVALFSKMTTPMCMIILGMRLASVELPKLFKRKFAYAVGVLKLIVYPLFVWLIARLIPGVDPVFRASLYILSAAPCAAAIQNLSELYNCEQELAANAVMVATLMSLLTLPLSALLI